jgi:hypothetical protein
MALVNARLSPRSLRRARRIRWLIEPALASLAVVIAQTPRDAERLRTLGVEGALVAGNLKFDRPVDAALAALGRQWRAGLSGQESGGKSGGKSSRPVILAASTRDGEEADLLADLNRKMFWVFVFAFLRFCVFAFLRFWASPFFGPPPFWASPTKQKHFSFRVFFSIFLKRIKGRQLPKTKQNSKGIIGN